MKRSTEKVLSDFQSLVSSLESLAAEAAERAGDHLEEAAGGFREKLKDAREHLSELERAVKGALRPPSRAPDSVGGVPWMSLALVAGAAFLCGVLVAHRGLDASAAGAPPAPADDGGPSLLQD